MRTLVIAAARHHLLALGLCVAAASCQAWTAADDERNRQRAMAQARQNTAQFEAYNRRTQDRMQSATARSRASNATPAAGGSAGARFAPPANSAVGQLGQTLGALRDRMNGPPASGAEPTAAEAEHKVLARFLADAQSGNHAAAVLAGQMYYSGYGTPRDDAKAAALFKRAGEMGNPDGAYHYAYMRTYGYGVAADPAEGVAWYQRAALAGSARGELGYFTALVSGQGITRNEAQAIPFMKSLAGRRLGGGNDPELVEAQALAAGLLGNFYQHGTGVEKNITEALAWYGLAAQMGDKASARDLARIYGLGEGVAKDLAQSLAWTAKGAELGDAEAQANMGLMLIQGKEVAKDTALGVRLVQASAAQGNGFAWSLLGDFHRDGLLPIDHGLALKAYQKAVVLGYAEARYSLTPALVRTAAISLAPGAAASDRSAALAGDQAAMLRMADRCADALGVAEDMPQALSWYTKAGALGNAAAQGIQGVLLITGQAGSKDVKRGIELVRSAAAAGDPGAMVTMGDLFANRLLDAPDANAQAKQWYQRALAAGNPEAERRLAAAR